MLRATTERVRSRRRPALREHAYVEPKALIVRGDLSPGSFLVVVRTVELDTEFHMLLCSFL